MASFDKAILPGQEGKVTLQINTKNRKGTFKQRVTIFSNDPQKPTTKISITCSVKQYITVNPSIRITLQGHYGDKIKKKVTITSLEDQPLKITDITTDIKDKIKYKLKKIEKGKKYSLEIKTRSGIKESFRGKLALKTSSKKKPELELFVIGKLQKEVKISPEYLYFGIIDTSRESIDPKSLERMATVVRVKGGGLSIVKIEPGSKWITTEIETNKKEEKYTVIITLDKDKLPKGKFREKVVVQTKYNKKLETAIIIIEGKVI